MNGTEPGLHSEFQASQDYSSAEVHSLNELITVLLYSLHQYSRDQFDFFLGFLRQGLAM